MTKAGTKAGAISTRHATTAVFRHELRLLIYSAQSYLFLSGFLICLSAAIFLIADFYASDEASVHFMLLFAPWVGVVFVPALAMGMWVNEKTDSSAEFSLTLPISNFAIVLGKFLAGLTVLCVMLVLSLPFPLTVWYLGEPDFGRIVGSYIGLAMMFGLFFSVSLFAAALIRERIGGFIVGLAILFFLMLLGWDVFSNLLKGLIAANLIEFIALYSPRTWLLRIGDGLIEVAGLAYFMGAIALALFATAIVSEKFRVFRSSGKATTMLSLSAILILLALVPKLSEQPLALDLTEEQELFAAHSNPQHSRQSACGNPRHIVLERQRGQRTGHDQISCPAHSKNPDCHGEFVRWAVAYSRSRPSAR